MWEEFWLLGLGWKKSFIECQWSNKNKQKNILDIFVFGLSYFITVNKLKEKNGLNLIQYMNLWWFVLTLLLPYYPIFGSDSFSQKKKINYEKWCNYELVLEQRFFFLF